MKKIVSIGLIVGLVLAGIVLGVVLTNLYHLPSTPESRSPKHQPPEMLENRTPFIEYRNREIDFEWYYTAKSIISIVNITLVVALLVIYLKIYREIKSKFTEGLIIVMAVLLMYALTSNPHLQWLFGLRAFGQGPFAMIPDLFTSVALIVLLYLSLN